MASIGSHPKLEGHAYSSLNQTESSPSKQSEQSEVDKSPSKEHPLPSTPPKSKPIVRSQSYRYDPQLGTLVPEEPNCCTRHVGKCICIVFVLASMIGLMRVLVGFAFNSDANNPCELTGATHDVNLTAEGSADWLHHGYHQNKYAINRKRTGYYLNLTWDNSWTPSYATKLVYWSDGTVTGVADPTRDAAMVHSDFGHGVKVLCPRCHSSTQYLLEFHFGCIFDCAIKLPTGETCRVKSSSYNYVYSYNFTGYMLKSIDPIELIAIDSYWGASDITLQAVTLAELKN